MTNRDRVCVTGGTGFIGSWLIMRLLRRGYVVNATVRVNPVGSKDVGFLRSLPGAEENLRIVVSDLSIPGSFDPAIEGCVGVFHVATPVDFEGKEPEEVVVKRTVDGTLDLLRACLRSGTVKRFVYTSSASAVVFNGAEPGEALDESSWSDVDYLRRTMTFPVSYMVSKTLAEKAVLEFGEEHGLDVVTVIPSFVHGPFICPKFPGSVRTCLAMIMGNEEEYPSLLKISLVHVDDVASAHIFLFENSDVKGRYICSSHDMTAEDTLRFLSDRYPEFSIPPVESLKGIKVQLLPGLSSQKLMAAGFKFEYGVEEMFNGAIQSCREKGYL
ncbi:hypothetical protein MLD38_018205 [Melastoma candidum]|uniref:Uncharacterized protein n=1 Tax=Melastoma candidum TaxID=119954 RepID=A0ACB9QW87_9MYRT|nr:hypothetical protein MLD38_018205 [Melastoma candidum]